MIADSTTKERVVVLGSTGSIGVNTLDVISKHGDRFEVYALAAGSNASAMLQQVLRHKPRYAVLHNDVSAKQLRAWVKEAGSDTEVLAGDRQMVDLCRNVDVDTVMAAIVGAAGLPSTMSALQAGKKVLLANKESLVMAGQLMTSAQVNGGAQLLPVDSEHNAIFQCLPPSYVDLADAGVRQLLLTGSGGPFRKTPVEQLQGVTVAQACRHPNWSMGPKISVDSATMMNKGLEFIEACWLFRAKAKDVKVVVHPQSIIHSMVEYIDGSVVAQMGQPDMRTPIAHCLGWPDRIVSDVPPLNFFEMGALEFLEPDLSRFPCLSYAIDAMKHGGSYPAALNAANEVAVAAFLQEKIGFVDIANTVDQVLQAWVFGEPSSLEEVLEADCMAREAANRAIGWKQAVHNSKPLN